MPQNANNGLKFIQIYSGVTPEKAKNIAQDENKKLQHHLEAVLEEMKTKMENFETSPPLQPPSSSPPPTPAKDTERLLKAVNSQRNVISIFYDTFIFWRFYE